jgi:hypothetical protein
MAMKNSISALLGGRLRMTRNNIGGMAINLIPATPDLQPAVQLQGLDKIH